MQLARSSALLAINIIAFPRISMAETDWVSLLKATDKPVEYKILLSVSRAIRFNVLTNSESPPNDSKAMGINWTPMLSHCWEYCSNFLSSAALRAKPDFLAAFEIILVCNGEIMVTSRAVGCPAHQQGKNTSPGREFVSCIRVFCSHTGDRLAALQAVKNYSVVSQNCIASPMTCNSMITECIKRSRFTTETLLFVFIFGSAQSVLHSCAKLVWQEMEAESRYVSCR